MKKFERFRRNFLGRSDSLALAIPVAAVIPATTERTDYSQALNDAISHAEPFLGWHSPSTRLTCAAMLQELCPATGNSFPVPVGDRN